MVYRIDQTRHELCEAVKQHQDAEKRLEETKRAHEKSIMECRQANEYAIEQGEKTHQLAMQEKSSEYQRSLASLEQKLKSESDRNHSLSLQLSSIYGSIKASDGKIIIGLGLPSAVVETDTNAESQMMIHIEQILGELKKTKLQLRATEQQVEVQRALHQQLVKELSGIAAQQKVQHEHDVETQECCERLDAQLRLVVDQELRFNSYMKLLRERVTGAEVEKEAENTGGHTSTEGIRAVMANSRSQVLQLVVGMYSWMRGCILAQNKNNVAELHRLRSAKRNPTLSLLDERLGEESSRFEELLARAAAANFYDSVEESEGNWERFFAGSKGLVSQSQKTIDSTIMTQESISTELGRTFSLVKAEMERERETLNASRVQMHDNSVREADELLTRRVNIEAAKEALAVAKVDLSAEQERLRNRAAILSGREREMEVQHERMEKEREIYGEDRRGKLWILALVVGLLVLSVAGNVFFAFGARLRYN